MAALVGCTACTSIDCSLDSVVVWTLTFYDSETEEPLKLPCILTIDADGAGTIYNRANNVNSIELPMSHAGSSDVLRLKWANKNQDEDGGTKYLATDILTIAHDNFSHFDAMDCPGAVFHTITSYTFEGHSPSAFPVTIDSIRIIRPQVDYNDVENIRLYLHNHSLTDVHVAEPTDVSGIFDVVGGETDGDK